MRRLFRSFLFGGEGTEGGAVGMFIKTQPSASTDAVRLQLVQARKNLAAQEGS